MFAGGEEGSYQARALPVNTCSDKQVYLPSKRDLLHNSIDRSDGVLKQMADVWK